MKITLIDLAKNIAQTLQPIYWIAGDDITLQEQAITTLQNAAKKHGFVELLRLHTESKSNWSSIYRDLQTNSLFAAKRIILLYLGEGKVPVAGKEFLLKYATNPNPAILLIIVSDKIDKTTVKNPVYLAIDKIGTIVTIWPLTPSQMAQWIINRANSINLMIDRDVATMLGQYHQNNLLALDQTLTKLSLIHGQAPLQVPDVLPLLQESSEFSIFDLARESLLGQAKNVNIILQTLRQQQVEPLIILWALTQEIRDLLFIQEHLSERALPALFSERQIWTLRQAPLKAALQRHNVASAQHLLHLAQNVDMTAKGLGNQAIWIALTNLACAIVDPKLLTMGLLEAG